MQRTTYVVFGSIDLLAALAGHLCASWLRSATTIAATLFELDALADAFVGGVAAAGGVAKVTLSVIGALLMAYLANGMNPIGTDISLQYIVRAGVLASAGMLDVSTRAKSI